MSSNRVNNSSRRSPTPPTRSNRTAEETKDNTNEHEQANSTVGLGYQRIMALPQGSQIKIRLSGMDVTGENPGWGNYPTKGVANLSLAVWSPSCQNIPVALEFQLDAETHQMLFTMIYTNLSGTQRVETWRQHNTNFNPKAQSIAHKKVLQLLSNHFSL